MILQFSTNPGLQPASRQTGIQHVSMLNRAEQDFRLSSDLEYRKIYLLPVFYLILVARPNLPLRLSSVALPYCLGRLASQLSWMPSKVTGLSHPGHTGGYPLAPCYLLSHHAVLDLPHRVQFTRYLIRTPFVVVAALASPAKLVLPHFQI